MRIIFIIIIFILKKRRKETMNDDIDTTLNYKQKYTKLPNKEQKPLLYL